MNTKIKAALFPTVFAIAMAIASIGIPIPGTMSGTPWLTAYHEQMINATDQINKVDNYAYFLWGLQNTVVGKTIQSTFVPYDPLGDFPMFSMYAIIIAIIIGVLAILSNRTPSITIKGRDIKTNISFNPMMLLTISAMLMTVAIVYLYYASSDTIIPFLENSDYKVNTGIGFQFMGVSAAAFVIAIVMTHINRKSEEKASEEDSDEEDLEGGVDKEDNKYKNDKDGLPNLKELVK